MEKVGTLYIFQKMPFFALAVKVKYEIKNTILCSHTIRGKVMQKASVHDLFFVVE